MAEFARLLHDNWSVALSLEHAVVVQHFSGNPSQKDLRGRFLTESRRLGRFVDHVVAAAVGAANLEEEYTTDFQALQQLD